MKTMKAYKKPEMEVIKIATAVIMAGSPVNSNPSGQDWTDEEEGD